MSDLLVLTLSLLDTKWKNPGSDFMMLLFKNNTTFVCCPFDLVHLPCCAFSTCCGGCEKGYFISFFFFRPELVPRELDMTSMGDRPEKPSALGCADLWHKPLISSLCSVKNSQKTTSSIKETWKESRKCLNMLKSQNVISSTELFRIYKFLCELDTDAPGGFSHCIAGGGRNGLRTKVD